jgi:putative sigma-54 modulation protein
MVIHFTSRHFKAHESLNEYAENAVQQVAHFFDGVIRTDVILSFEKKHKSTKIAEVHVSVHNAVLVGVGKSEDFFKSIDEAVEKVTAQVKRYKSKLKAKDRDKVRKVRGKLTP